MLGQGEEGVRRGAALLSVIVGAGVLGVKYAAYLHTGSAAILSDALESITNVVGALFAFLVLVFAGRPADRTHPYGHGKLEYFSAAFEGGLIAFAAVMILWYAAMDLARGSRVEEVDLGLVLTVGAGLANAGLGWFLLRTGRRVRSITLEADGKHVLSDFWTSLGVVLGLSLVRLTGQTWLDPAAALAVGVNLAVTGVRLVRRAAGGLLDEEDTKLLDELVAAIDANRQPAIIRVHRLRAIRAGRFTHVDAHLVVPEFWPVAQGHELTESFAARVIDACDVDGEITFHTDPCRRALCSVCELADCPVRIEPFTARPKLTVAEATQTDEAFWPGGHDALVGAAREAQRTSAGRS